MSEKEGMKKGPWTAAEDGILAEYVEKHGEGNWNSVQKNSVLMRCGKSCRLRWANHLRPNLKKGAFSPEEERSIIELHAKLGNKWARMAAQLPGRTDNEIKNYWNTRLKRRQRAGLPIYPQQETTTPGFDHHLQLQQQQFQLGLGRKRPISCCSPHFPSSQRQNMTYSYNLSNFSPNFNTYGNHHPTIPPNNTDIFNFQYSDHNHNKASRFVFPMSQIPSTTNQNLDGHECSSGLSYSSLLMGQQVPHDDSAYNCGQHQREGEAFDDLLMATHHQSLSDHMHLLAHKDKDHPSTGPKQEAASEEISSMDDDLSSLLTTFQWS